MCKVKERKIEPRCYNGWGMAHINAMCGGPNREAL